MEEAWKYSIVTAFMLTLQVIYLHKGYWQLKIIKGNFNFIIETKILNEKIN